MQVLSGVIWSNDATFFEGVDDYVQTPEEPMFLTNDFTVSVWLNQTSFDGEVGKAFFSSTVREGVGNAKLFAQTVGAYSDAIISSNSIVVMLTNSASCTIPNTWTAADLGVWRHVVFTFSSTNPSPQNVKIYKDGTLLSMFSTNVISAFNTNTGGIIIGKRSEGSYPWHGSIQAVKFDQREWSAAEVLVDFQAGRR